MTDPRQSGAGPGARGQSFDCATIDCATVDQWLAESAESALPAAVAGQVRLHAAGCSACTEKIAQARRGREWLLVLKQESLHPPVDLVAKILARTSLAKASLAIADVDRPVLDFPRLKRTNKAADDHAIPPGTQDQPQNQPEDQPQDQYSPREDFPIPAWQHSSVVVLRRTLFDPRLALVAAMAFFSISLTLNMMGFRLTGLRAADFKPQNMHRAIVRQVASTDASVVRYYENLRIVYEVEARVQQLRRAAETTPPPQQTTRPRKQSFDPAGDSSGSSSNPASNSQDSQDSHGQRLAAGPDARHAQPSDPPDPRPIITGPRMDAAFHLPSLQAYPARAFLLKVRSGNVNSAWPFPKERPHIEDLATPQYQEKCSVGWVEIAIEHTLATSFASPFPPAPQAAPCSLRTICSSMRYFSTRERRLA